MDIMNFKYLLEVYRCKSINKAAQNLFVSQPQLSKIVKSMEKEYGLNIFERKGNRLQVTMAGEKFIQDAAYFVSTYEELFEQKHEDDTVNIAIEKCTYAYTMVAHSLETYTGNIGRLKILERNQEEILTYLRNGEILAGFTYVDCAKREIFQRQCASDGLEYRTIAPLYNRVLVHGSHPLAWQRDVDVEELYKYPLVLFDFGGPHKLKFYHIYAPFFEKLDINKIKEIIYVEDLSALHTMLKMTKGYILGFSLDPETLLDAHRLYMNACVFLNDPVAPQTLELGFVTRQEVTPHEAELVDRLLEASLEKLKDLHARKDEYPPKKIAE